MSRTSRFKGLISVYSGIGALLLTILGFIPGPLANTLNAPLYVGYQLTVLSTILIGITLGVYHISNVIKDESEKTRDALNKGEFLEMVESLSSKDEEDEEDEEQVATDGGRSFSESDSGTRAEHRDITGQEEFDANLPTLLEQFSIEPTGKGVLAGVVIGGVLGLSFGTSGVFIGGILGGLLGNELEYQFIKRKRQSVLGLELGVDESTTLNSDLVYDILKNRYRRHALEILDESSGEININELTERVVSKELQKLENQEDQEWLKGQVYNQLYETHLEKLEDAGFVRFNKSTGTIVVERKLDEIRPFIHLDRELEGVGNRDLLYDLLKNRRRRFVIQVLLEEGGTMQISELADRVATLEHDVSKDELPSQERKRVFTALYQTHLRKMHDAGVIDFDPKTGLVEIDGQINEVDPLRIPNSNIVFSWPLYYLCTSLLALAIYLGYEVNLKILVQTDPGLLVLVYILSVSLSSAYQIWTNS